jgi:hypothetical protein
MYGIAHKLPLTGLLLVDQNPLRYSLFRGRTGGVETPENAAIERS